ncbi:xanthine dehydrogenase family protein molybdopterin-binding subunit [Allosphingosinicella flava]|uniref:Xanthine dehydrogenase family protein molybdopterin-binding subunit n=1 Tax=Allosphingosinicella flava TaxID=2771430 RepID=A0A7T2LM97_9SPHN|nr:molybdopterin cofactor-binding domain-containing protein [Sphingosinicella flava]QPQ54832.1 xanthine dehydrogenase family protein molybdopterin-binding subunit [Sphingosinicella flava]
MAKQKAGTGVSRRTLLVGGGAGAGLILAWRLWPRAAETSLRAAPGESIFNAYLKIGSDGRVIVAVPQMELGQGVYTALPQILADELGADWRTVAVEPAPLSPLYSNRLLSEDEEGSWISGDRNGIVMTGGSTSVRAFETPLREAGAAARALLCKAAAERWNVDWREVETADGFALHKGTRLSFGELAEAASGYDVPGDLPMREGQENRLTGRPLPRIDVPAKVDGSARFAGDVRLPGMLFGAVRAGPPGGSRLERVDREAAERVPGVRALFENPRWAGAVATNWWAANRAVEAMKPVFETAGLVSSADADAALAEAMEAGEPSRFIEQGDADQAFIGGTGFAAHYSAGPAATVPMETLCATARMEGGRIEVWAPAQAPGLARAAAARAAGVPEKKVTLYPMPIGGGYGRKLETLAVEQAVVMAMQVGKPVQLSWSRLEEMTQDRYRPPALARLQTRMGESGRIAAFSARIAAPATALQTAERLKTGQGGDAAGADASAVAGAAPPYGIPTVLIDHVPVDVRIPTGLWRSGARGANTFFVESFIDEVARQVGVEPLSFRMTMLGDNPRLARVLTTAASLGGWDGGVAGGSMGIACHSAYGSHAALLVEVKVAEGRRVSVERAVCAVDCGRIVNPELLRQQIEGGIIYGIAAALARPIAFEDGLPTVRTLVGLDFPRLDRAPDIMVEIVDSGDEPGGATELAVPLAAPALANAIFAASGQRLRALPLQLGAG